MADWTNLANKLKDMETVTALGLVSKVTGLLIEANGPKVSVGRYCCIVSSKSEIPAEVVGFKDNKTLLMPLGELEGVSPGDKVIPQKEKLAVKVGSELLGRVLDGLGNPLEGRPLKSNIDYPLQNAPPHALLRPRVSEPLSVGVRSVDGLLTIGRGQRMGIFAGSGVGKSTLLGMMARNTQADINVIALVGERGRELREFIEKDLGPEGISRSVIVVATSDQPALVRIKAAFTATAIAEYFRDTGKNVLLMMDSVTRFAMAQREVGLTIGEPPATRGYPPSVFAMLPKLLERAGMAEKGSITGLYTVLVDGDDHNEPIADAVRGILDGHIVLSRDLAARNHFPSIDILQSVSRCMSDVAEPEMIGLAGKVRELLAVYQGAKDLIDIGAYVRGSNAKIDTALKYMEKITLFLCQSTDEKFNGIDMVAEIKKIFTEEGRS
ncbi:type III secretion system ATPase, FliI/YscN [Syntrophobotulus glycolicus DSM 8271]|uniref:Type III secretion system ATPase, FliI/YscN n=1 Tax=Syntrophobotulus glycolicus (strain DSM 8271 / FlGlyR) TaxID=645991 RepID=F0SZF6_SYNGF|nr:flagellar protein export ATPase FliI [Syntrophobotulus glycolicus]ADY54961.1 type III secretion system ATPase, FliI/YscN [Syntrophobotulus glycolicus DSM 8271]